MNISDIITQFGAYYLDHGQNRQNLINELLKPTDTVNLPGVQNIRTKETVYRTAYTNFGDTLQAYQHAFTPAGAATFNPQVIELNHMKSDIAINDIDSIEASWLGWLAGDSSRNLKDWPIVRYIMEVLWLPKLRENFELYTIYKGVYAAPSAGTAGTPAGAMDGIKKKLKDGAGRSDNAVNSVANIGALAEGTIYQQVEAFAKAIDTMFHNEEITLFVAPEFETAYKKAVRDLKGYVYFSDKDIDTRVDFTNFRLKGVNSMRGTTDIWATLPNNMLYIQKMGDSMGDVDVQQHHRDISVMLDYWKAVGFENNNLVWASDATLL